MESSKDAATTTKCFSAILSRLLCSGSLPTHPSDHLHQLTSTESTHQSKATKFESHSHPIQASSNSTPGIVARLMGLDPFPDTTSLTKTRTLESILRSKSANYVEYYLPHLDFPKVQAQKRSQEEAHDQAHHRRVRTSVSFRDVPTFLHPHNHDLLLVCLDQVDEISRKSELGLKEAVRGVNNEIGREKVISLKKREKKEEKNNKSITKRKEEEITDGPSSSRPRNSKLLGQKRDVNAAKPSVNLKKGKSPEKRPLNPKESCVELKATKKKGNENISQKSSSKSNTTSSSGFHDSPFAIRAPMISENPGSMGLTSRKISSPRFTSRVKDEDQSKSKTNKPLKSKEGEGLVVDMLIEVCRLAEEDIKRGDPVWIARNDFKLVEEICLEFEQETLEMLLYQLTDELCATSSKLGLNF